MPSADPVRQKLDRSWWLAVACLVLPGLAVAAQLGVSEWAGYIVARSDAAFLGGRPFEHEDLHRALHNLAEMVPLVLLIAPLGLIAWRFSVLRWRHRHFRCLGCGYPRVYGADLCPECGDRHTR